MKAVTRGSAGVFSFDENYATPVLTSPKEVLVEIKAAAINPVDYKVGKMLLGPRVGLDFSGVVKQVGTGVTELAVGDEVFGTAAGSLAEFVTVDAGRIARKPASASFVQAAAMPTAYLTGLQALRAGGVNGDSKVLTNPNPNPHPNQHPNPHPNPDPNQGAGDWRLRRLWLCRRADCQGARRQRDRRRRQR
jgi:NADPH:quinone reductase-like Zn-dependent oxidoreductase